MFLLDSHWETLKKVQNLRKTTPRYQQASYGPECALLYKRDFVQLIEF